MLIFVCLIAGLFPGNIKLFRGEASGIVRQIAQLWIIFIWGTKPIFLRTDYKTSMWKLPVLCGIYAFSAYGVNGHVNTPTLYRVLWGIGYIVGIEIYGYKALSEQATLYLKSEVILRQSQATNKAFYEIPVSIVITKYKNPNAVRFSN